MNIQEEYKDIQFSSAEYQEGDLLPSFVERATQEGLFKPKEFGYSFIHKKNLKIDEDGDLSISHYPFVFFDENNTNWTLLEMCEYKDCEKEEFILIHFKNCEIFGNDEEDEGIIPEKDFNKSEFSIIEIEGE